MSQLGPFMFIALRFLLGALALCPLFLLAFFKNQPLLNMTFADLWPTSIIGVCLFGGAALQQIGLQYTSVANAGFITSSYIVLVPLIGFAVKSPPTFAQCIGAAVTFVGVGVLSVNGELGFNRGDLYQLLGAFFWASQIWVLSLYARRFNNLHIAVWQSLVCGVLALAIALIFETTTVVNVIAVWPSLVFAGVMSSGIAYGLQVFGQQFVAANKAVFILSLESVVATICGVYFLSQAFTIQTMIGCCIILFGLYVAHTRLKIPALRQ